MKRILSVLLVLIIATGFTLPCFAEENVQATVIVETVFFTDDLLYREHVVLENIGKR